MANNFFSDVKKVSLTQTKDEKEVEKVYKTDTTEIDIDKLIPYRDSDGKDNDYVFGPISDESIQNLAKGIKESGFKTAVEVWELQGEDKGKYMIYSGHRRVHAMRFLKAKTVKCDVYVYPEAETDRRLQFLRANIHSRGSIKAAEEGRDLYIAHQIQYLEDIFRRKGIRSQAEVDRLVCSEFHAKKNTVWKYKSLLKACDELIEAESKGYILIEQAASISVFSKEDQKIIVSAIMKYVNSGKKLFGRDIDAVIKKIHAAEDGSLEDYQKTLSISGVSDIIAQILSKQMSSSDLGKKETAWPAPSHPGLYDRYATRFNWLHKEFTHNKIDDLAPEEISKLLADYAIVKESLDTALVFSELMAGRYQGKEVFPDFVFDNALLSRFNIQQLHKLEKAYEKVHGFENLVTQLSTAEAELTRQ